ncbi:MAG: M24 family metallopeptidase, partial [Candidatus Thorarchaeota archaeon]
MTFKPHPSQIKAGQIAARVLKEVSQEILPGTKVFKICTLAEKLIIKYGARPAFPCTVSTDHITAHYTSPDGDQTIIPNTGLVKLDV